MLLLLMLLMVLHLVGFVAHAAVAPTDDQDRLRYYCPAKALCARRRTELERWACLGEVLYSPQNLPALLARFADPDAADAAAAAAAAATVPGADLPLTREIMVTHDCSGVGWGNAMRGLYGAVSIATSLGRRLIVMYDTMHRMFLPPFGEHWDLGLWAAGRESPLAPTSANGVYRFTITETFDFEAHGRAPGRFQKWSHMLQNASTPLPTGTTAAAAGANKGQGQGQGQQRARREMSEHETKNLVAWTRYEAQPLTNAGICGGEREMLTTGNCLPKVLKRFLKPTCVNELPEFMLLVPHYYTLFRRPAPPLVKALRTIRRRLHLPVLADGLEPAPGAWGLHTPGYYIYALHFRRVPLGFEPLSAEINAGQRNREYRDEVLEGFWETARANVAQAKALADCRGEKLIIYFATDDVRLRAVARDTLKPWGKVVWGLKRSEIGHISPQWRDGVDDGQIEKTAQQLINEGYFKAPGGAASTSKATAGAEAGASGAPEVEVGVEVTGDAAPLALAPRDVILQVSKDADATRLHGDMALAEWWVLASATWLQSHSGTSFSDTAAGWGLGPGGHMERIDVVHGRHGHVQVARRREWREERFCKEVGAADPDQAATCPNK